MDALLSPREDGSIPIHDPSPPRCFLGSAFSHKLASLVSNPYCSVHCSSILTLHHSTWPWKKLAPSKVVPPPNVLIWL